MNKQIDKVIKEGKTAVIYSANFGSGWYSEHYIRDLLFDSKLVELILHPNFGNIRYSQPGDKNYDKELDDKVIEYCKEVNERKYVLKCPFGGDDYVYRCYQEDSSYKKHKIYSLDIKWVPGGKKFVISNYDGKETVYVEDEYEKEWNYA